MLVTTPRVAELSGIPLSLWTERKRLKETPFSIATYNNWIEHRYKKVDVIGHDKIEKMAIV